MKLIKTINRENEIEKLYNQPLEGGVSVRMNDKQYWMVTIKKDFINSKIKRRIMRNYCFRLKQMVLYTQRKH